MAFFSFWITGDLFGIFGYLFAYPLLAATFCGTVISTERLGVARSGYFKPGCLQLCGSALLRPFKAIFIEKGPFFHGKGGLAEGRVFFFY